MIWEIWWVWVAAGIGLAILELLAPGFIFVGFAIGAVLVGVLVGLGVVLSLPWALVTFAVVSVVAWVVLRQTFGVRKGQRKVFKHDINED
jgi:membrane protein implicated in regulation of membrane protease activity